MRGRVQWVGGKVWRVAVRTGDVQAPNRLLGAVERHLMTGSRPGNGLGAPRHGGRTKTAAAAHWTRGQNPGGETRYAWGGGSAAQGKGRRLR